MRPDLASLRARLPARPLTRFAPAPTGFLHLGHVASAVCVWGLARALGGRVLLRIEDHDRQRSRLHYERALLADLDWLGFAPDVGPASEGPRVSRQSDREALYREVAEQLAAAGRVYVCACSRRDVDRATRGAASSGPLAELHYPGTCRDRGLPIRDGLGWRVRIEPGAERFEDGWQGAQVQEPARQCGDLLIRDRLGNWTYQFAATVDDREQGIALVIRGLDLLASTGRQIRLARLLGRARPPVFVHHGLLLKSPDQKLSKSDGDTGVAALRAAGSAPEAVIGEAARRLGLQSEPRPLPAGAVAELFADT
jgi:glutamyl-Q tRNA(Asp) synthetase